ncbi:outer membrane protein assembly factor BamB [Vibrio rumoiensis]|uniref:Outer membrane protein assembly factor BamB n=1 Tax=Vibrio rumoiensis 1S-45 TaxID=1188252 RepID=A0A1E5E5H9_9VIBR|nr:outer membrane protein assembly factor BamB [Vibrio rumoiensis]OEF28610.1 outer membrane protein assembly factor BamB [Vibrio rumoiensis 1S-45]
MRKMFNRSLALTVITLGLLGCSSEEDTIVMSPLPVVKSEFTPSTEWTASVGDGVGHFFSKLSPVYAYDKVFVASRDGEIKALDPETGKTLWKKDLGEDKPARLSGGLTASYDKLYIGSENGQAYALSVDDGSIVWQKTVDGEVLAKPLADESLVMFHTSKGSLVALKQDTGDSAWEISNEVPNLTLRGDSSPVSVSGGVFWGMSNGRLAAALIEKGQLLWQQPIGTPKGSTEIDRLVDVDSTPLIIGSSLYSVGINGQLVGIDLRSGTPIWKRTYSSATDLASDGSRIFVITDKDHISAVDVRSGTQLWNNDSLQYRQLTSPTIINDYLVVADNEGYLHWIDRTTGKFVAQQLIDDEGIAVAPVQLDDGFVVMTRDGEIKKMQIR